MRKNKLKKCSNIYLYYKKRGILITIEIVGRAIGHQGIILKLLSLANYYD